MTINNNRGKHDPPNNNNAPKLTLIFKQNQSIFAFIMRDDSELNTIKACITKDDDKS